MKSLVLPAVLVALGASVAGAEAMPTLLAPPAPSLAPTRVAMGCRPGYTRDAAGHCHHAFNRFRSHEKFRAFKREHCTAVRTPNGKVKRCRI